MITSVRSANACIYCVQALVQQALSELAPSAVGVDQGAELHLKQDKQCVSNRTKNGVGRSNQPGPAFASSLCVAQVNMLLSSSSLVASSQATAEEIVNEIDADVFCCVLDGVFVNVMNQPNKQTVTACVSHFSVLQQRQSQSVFKESTAHELPLISSHARATLPQARKLRNQADLSLLSKLVAAWSRTVQVLSLSYLSDFASELGFRARHINQGLLGHMQRSYIFCMQQSIARLRGFNHTALIRIIVFGSAEIMREHQTKNASYSAIYS